MEHWTEYTRFLTALVVILDPFLAVPIFLGLTAGYDQVQRARVALIVSLTVAIVLVAAALSGELVLSLLGTSLSSFRVGGGLVLLLMALAMLRAEADSMRSNPQETTADPSHQGVGVVPLAIPLLAGPGAISTVIIQMDRSTAPYHGLTVIACILLVCFALWLVLRLAAPIGRFLSPTALNVINRLFGLILAAIAVEIMANGLKQLFPALAG
jgi:multiple antibiotic resistance protein